jgi:putative addiction module component (TIGR02574 family)
MRTTLLKKAAKLPVTERIKLVLDIWDSIAAEPDKVPLTASQKRELNRRVKLLQENPGRGIPWETAKRQILKRSTPKEK